MFVMQEKKVLWLAGNFYKNANFFIWKPRSIGNITEGKQLLVLKNVLSAREMQKDPDKHSDDFIPKNTLRASLWFSYFSEQHSFPGSEFRFLEFHIQL